MLAYSETGSGKPILFLHGLGLNRNFWASTIVHLSPTHRCIALDLPGHGESLDVICNGKMSVYAGHVRTLIEKMHLNDITLVGHSMGGQIAMILALQMPSVITKLVLVSPAGIETFTSEEREKIRAGSTAIWKNPVSEDFLQRVYAAAGNNSLMSEHLEQQRNNFDDFSTMLLNSISGMLDEPVFQHLDKLTQPVLCLFGGMDTAIPNRYVHPQMTTQQLADAAKSKIRNCDVRIFPMAGHYLPVEFPQELSQSILGTK